MNRQNLSFNFRLKQSIQLIQKMISGDTISIGYEYDKWWCEIAPIGHSTYSDENVFDALDKMAKWVEKNQQ